MIMIIIESVNWVLLFLLFKFYLDQILKSGEFFFFVWFFFSKIEQACEANEMHKYIKTLFHTPTKHYYLYPLLQGLIQKGSHMEKHQGHKDLDIALKQTVGQMLISHNTVDIATRDVTTLLWVLLLKLRDSKLYKMTPVSSLLLQVHLDPGPQHL